MLLHRQAEKQGAAMFKSKQRPIAIPQWERQKLAGTLALLWGNAEFERPPVPFDSLLTGIGLHDRAYDPLDNLPIGEILAVLATKGGARCLIASSHSARTILNQPLYSLSTITEASRSTVRYCLAV
jgi:hypothetical protein